jgi:hypothetical protein
MVPTPKIGVGTKRTRPYPPCIIPTPVDPSTGTERTKPDPPHMLSMNPADIGATALAPIS